VRLKAFGAAPEACMQKTLYTFPKTQQCKNLDKNMTSFLLQLIWLKTENNY